MSANSRSQRWKNRRTLFRCDNAVIDPTIHSVDVIHCQKIAKPFIEQHHYSASFPATRLSCGLYRNEGQTNQLVGVASFSVSMSQAAGPKYTGLDGNASVELGRLVLLDEVEGNGESWFLSRAFSLLRQEKSEIEAVFAYSDPVPRFDQEGRMTMPGHIGEIYQALSADCRGRAGSRWHHIAPNGSLISERSLSKIRLEERGSDYATRQLLDLGLAKRRFGETPREWIARLTASGEITKRRHPGNWVYSFGLTRRAKASARKLPSSPRPKRSAFNPEDVTADQMSLHLV